MKIKTILLWGFFLLSPSAIFAKESKLYEHYIGYTHLGYSLLLDKIQNTFVYSSGVICFSGEYRESQNADTLFLIGNYSTIPDTISIKFVFVKKYNKIINITEDNNDGLSNFGLKEMNKVKVPILKDEKELLNFRPWILR